MDTDDVLREIFNLKLELLEEQHIRERSIRCNLSDFIIIPNRPSHPPRGRAHKPGNEVGVSIARDTFCLLEGRTVERNDSAVGSTREESSRRR